MTIDTTPQRTTDVKKIAYTIARSFSQVTVYDYLNPNKTLQEKIDQLESRIQQFVDAGADIYQTGDHAAVAIWVDPNTIYPPSSNSHRDERSIEFGTKLTETIKRNVPSDQKVYSLAFLAKDPSKKDVKGLVSGLIRPVLAKAKSEGLPAVLDAISDHARDVYEHWGFETVDSFKLGEGLVNSKNEYDPNGEGLTVHYLIFNKDSIKR